MQDDETAARLCVSNAKGETGKATVVINATPEGVERAAVFSDIASRIEKPFDYTELKA